MSDFPPPQFPPPQPPQQPPLQPSQPSYAPQPPAPSPLPLPDLTPSPQPSGGGSRKLLGLPVWAWLVTAVVAVGAVVGVVIASGDDKSVDETVSETTQPESTDATQPTESSPSSVANTDGTSETTAPAETEAPDTEPPPTEAGPSSDVVSGAPDGITGDRANPVPVGQIADIGEGWRLQVLNVADGTEAVAAANEFNAPPPAGSSFTLVTVALGYFGLDDPRSAFETTISGVGAANIELGTDCGLLPDELTSFNEVFAGGVITGNLCFVTTPDDVAGLQLYASAGFSEDTKVFLDATAPPTAATPMSSLQGPQKGAVSTPARLAPTPLGTPADLGSGWQFVVAGPARDITDQVIAENSFNDPPPDGFRFVGVDVTYAYNGEGSAAAFSVTMNTVGNSNIQLVNNCGVFTGSVDDFVDIFAGGSVSGTICFVAPAADVSSIVLYGTASFENDYVMFATS